MGFEVEPRQSRWRRSAPAARRPRPARGQPNRRHSHHPMTTVQDVLDVVPVTDTVYDHLAFTRPLVDALVRAVRSVSPAGRVLVIGPNELLPAVLTDLGYDVDLWVVDGLPLSATSMRMASRAGPVEDLLVADGGPLADLVVAPYLLESVREEPDQALSAIGRNVKPGGYLVVACRQPGELR